MTDATPWITAATPARDGEYETDHGRQVFENGAWAGKAPARWRGLTEAAFIRLASQTPICYGYPECTVETAQNAGLTDNTLKWN